MALVPSLSRTNTGVPTGASTVRLPPESVTGKVPPVPVTVTVPVMVVLVRLTGTAVARSSASVSGPVTATLEAIDTGCVAWKNVPVTATDPVTDTVPESMMLCATAGSPAEPAPVDLRYFVAPDASRKVSFATF